MEPGLGFAACILAKWLASNDDPSKGVKSPGYLSVCLSDPLQACSCCVNQSETLNWLPPARRVIVIASRPDPEHVEGTTTKELLFEATIHSRPLDLHQHL
jgi:hypothetical protein